MILEGFVEREFWNHRITAHVKDRVSDFVILVCLAVFWLLQFLPHFSLYVPIPASPLMYSQGVDESIVRTAAVGEHFAIPMMPR